MRRNNFLIIKLFNFYILAAAMLMASCTDYDDYNSVPEDSYQPKADKTLWENISKDGQLTKIVDLAQKSNFVSTLNSARFYTMWAPVDETFDEAEYQRLMASDSATIVKQFFQQHMTEYNYPVSAALDSTTVISLNQKHHPFTKLSFDGRGYVANGINLPSSNGLMHKISGQANFYPNLYENLDSLVGCDNIKNYLQQYDEWELDLNASIAGPLVNGKRTYQDSVMKKHNNVINDIINARLEHEDSTYCMLLPTDEAWDEAYEKILPLYNYIPKLDYMDLSKKTAKADEINVANFKADKAAEAKENQQDSLTRRNIVTNLVFSNSSPYNAPLFNEGQAVTNDSVYSTRHHLMPAAQSILDHTIATAEMSNGLARTVDAFPFKPWDTYNPVVASYSPSALLDVRNNRLTTYNVYVDSLIGKRDSLFSTVPDMIKKLILPEGSRFFSYVGVDSADIQGSSGKPEFSFKLSNVRSTTYHIYVVTVPAQVYNPQAKVKPYYLRFYLSWTDANNKLQKTILPQGATASSKISTDYGTDTKTVKYLNNPGGVNAIDLGEFEFPVCYYGTAAYPSLMMILTERFTSSTLRNRYDQQPRIAGVFLVPAEMNDEYNPQTNNDDEN